MAFFLQQKKEGKKSSFATNSETGQVFKFQQKCLFVTFRRKLPTNAWGVEDNDISNEYSVWMSEMCVCFACQKNTKTNLEPAMVWSLGERGRQSDQAGICSLGRGHAGCQHLALTTFPDCQLLQEVISCIMVKASN